MYVAFCCVHIRDLFKYLLIDEHLDWYQLLAIAKNHEQYCNEYPCTLIFVLLWDSAE